MKKAVAPHACRRTHRRGGQERQSTVSGFDLGEGTGAGLWWGGLSESRRSEPSRRVNGCPALVTTTQGPRSGMIARQADYTSAHPWKFPGSEPHAMPSLQCPL